MFGLSLLTAAYGAYIVLDPIDRARSFEGVGGISGGGATSRLLIDYPEPKYSQILDILYTPQNAAAFSTIKVEIPADSDTTCGSEVAHRHDKDDGGSCTRGYEGIHLAAANARRPGITTSSLQWAAPHFVGEADVDGGKSLFTATNINEYVIPWLRCMKEAYGINLTWQGGGWNERPHNTTYIKLMRQSLDAAGLSSTGIAAADQCCGAGWNIIPELVEDPELRASVAVVSTHCAGSMNNQDVPQAAIDLGIPLFQGEEHIGLPDPDSVPIWEWPGASATGVEINQNWILSNMTATIFWPDAYGWLSGLTYQGKGFVVAVSPWGDAPCYVPTALWVVAHTTHFTTPRDSWLLNNSGSGHLTDARAPIGHGGWNISYVTYATGPQADMTLVVESFLQGGEWHSPHTTQPSTGAAAVGPTSAVFQLAGGFSKWAGTSLHVWHTNKTATFERLPDLLVAQDGTFNVTIEPNAIYTYTTVASAHPGAAAWLEHSAATGGCVAAPVLATGDLWPAESPFPLPYYDDFEAYANDTLPLFTSDMFGAFTVFQLPADAAIGGSSHPPPLRYRPGIDYQSVACGDAGAVAARPTRCTLPASTTSTSNTKVLRQWMRQPTLGWGGSSTNAATVFGNASLGNLSIGIRVNIETPDPGYTNVTGGPPYVLVGMHGGGGPRTSSSPRDFYRTDPDCDFVWMSATQWGCNIVGLPKGGAPSPCDTSHPFPFGMDTWHSIEFSEVPMGGGNGATYSFKVDGALLFNATVPTDGALKNGGAGGYVVLVTGNHRAQFDDLSLTLNTPPGGGEGRGPF